MMNMIPTRVECTQLAVGTHDLYRKFGGTQALAGMNLTVPEGAFYVLVGENGAGKTTLLRLLLDIVRADSGRAEVFGIDTRVGARVRAGIGWVPERHESLYGWMKVKEMLAWQSAYHASWDANYAARLTSALAVNEQAKLNRLSRGELRRVQLILALAHRPRLLLLDEPTDGLDPVARETVLGILSEHIADSPTTVLASTHLVREMDGLADHVGVVRRGKLLAQVGRDALESLMRSYSLEVPPDWDDCAGIGDEFTLVSRRDRQREVRWMVWGNQSVVAERLTASGAVVRDVSAVSLEDAAVALMTRDGDNS